MDNLIGKELFHNGDFEKGDEGWETVNLCLKKDTRDAYFEIVTKPQFNHNITESDTLISGKYAHFRTGNIHTWLTLKDGINLPAGEYTLTFAVKSYSTHFMFGIYSTKEVGCDDRFVPAASGSMLIDDVNESWKDINDFVENNGKYQKQWKEETLPVYATVKYCFTLGKETTIFPAIRGRSEAAVNSTEDVGIQSLYIDSLSLKCLKHYEERINSIEEYKASFILDKPVHNKNYAGLSAVFPCFWFLKDDTLEKPYTDAQLQISINKFLNMGIDIVRCVAFEPSYAWDSEKHCWDWNSDWMSGFYKYCDLMQKNGIEVVLNTAEGLTNPISQLGRENPIYYLAIKNNPNSFENYDSKNKTNEQMLAFHTELANWVELFAKEVINVRGYTNIKYWMEGTEVNNSSKEDIKFYQWMGWAKSVHQGFKNAGMRDKIKIVGPATAFDFNFSDTMSSTWKWLKWCVEDYEEVIDIYAAHAYGFPYVMGDDISDKYVTFTESCLDITKKTLKPFWHDEFNVLTDFGIYEESAEHPMQATQIALGQLCTMLSGSSTTMLWYPVDIKWPNRNDTCFPSWIDGIHILGLDRSILSGNAVPRYGYYVYCMLGTAIKSGDTVYKAEFDDNNQLYTMLLKHIDDSYSIVTVNMSYQENQIVYDLKDINNLVFERLEYDPDEFELPEEKDVGIGVDEFAVPTLKNKIIVSDKQLKMEGNLLFDKIAPYNVVVYNQVTREKC